MGEASIRCKVWGALLALVVLAGIGAIALPTYAYAAPGDKLSVAAVGSWSRIGGCEWNVSSGRLELRPASASAVLPEYSNVGSTPWYSVRSSIRSIQVDEGVKVVNGDYLFAGLDNLRSVSASDLAGLDVSAATSLSHLFYGCTALTSADLSGLDASSATDLSSMFENCNECRTIKLDGIVTGKAKTISNMFADCSSLVSIDLSSIDTSSVEDLSYVLRNCSSLTTFDASTIDTSSAKTIAGFFKDCFTLQQVDVSGWDTRRVESTSETFMHCEELRNIDISNWDLTSLRIAGSMFRGCLHVQKLDLSAFKNSHNLTDAFRMLCLCSRLESVDLRDIDFSGINRLEEMFLSCQSLKAVDARGADFSNVESAFRAFTGCTSLERVDFTGAKLGNLTTAEEMFAGCTSLERVDFTNAYLPELKGITQMFYGCSSLKDFVTDGATIGTISSAMYAFNGCTSLGTLDLSRFTAKGTSLTNLFNNCYVTSYIPMKNYSGDSPKTRPDISKVKFSVLDDRVYEKSFFTPSVTLSVPSGATYVWASLWGKDLIEGQHYTVSYKDNYSVGMAQVTIRGIGAFKGSVTKTFKINPKGTSVKKLSGKSKAIKVTWAKQATQANGYEIRYKAKGSSSWKTVTVNSPATTSKTIMGLKAKKSYTVEIRTFKKAGGKKYYSAWSASKTVNAR